MSAPVRVQRKRTPGWRMPPRTISVARPSRWGNPFVIARTAPRTWTVADSGDRSTALREEPQIFTEKWLAATVAVRLFELHTGPMGLYEYSREDLDDLRTELAGMDLACWCPLHNDVGDPYPCHADALIRLANQLEAPDDADR